MIGQQPETVNYYPSPGLGLRRSAYLLAQPEVHSILAANHKISARHLSQALMSTLGQHVPWETACNMLLTQNELCEPMPEVTFAFWQSFTHGWQEKKWTDCRTDCVQVSWGCQSSCSLQKIHTHKTWRNNIALLKGAVTAVCGGWLLGLQLWITLMYGWNNLSMCIQNRLLFYPTYHLLCGKTMNSWS